MLLHGKEGVQLHGLQLSDFGVGDVQEWKTSLIDVRSLALEQ